MNIILIYDNNKTNETLQKEKRKKEKIMFKA